MYAAAELFAVQGFEITTVAQTRHAAGISVDDLFHYLRYKHELFVANITDDGDDRTDQALANARTAHDALTGKEDIVVARPSEAGEAYRVGSYCQVRCSYPPRPRSKLHHAAFDRHIPGVRPDLHVVVRQDRLAEVERSAVSRRSTPCTTEWASGTIPSIQGNRLLAV